MRLHKTIMVVFVLGLSAAPVMGLNVTLSDAGLMALDWYLPSNLNSVIGRRDVPGPGVEFDLRFPSIESGEYGVSYVSCKYGGTGALVGIDISMYNKYELKFTLVSVDGVSTPGTGGVLGVGALINLGTTWGFYPRGIDLLPSTSYGRSAISSTSIDADRTSIIGFIAYIPPSMEAGWNPSGTTVTLLVEPSPGAVTIPEPVTVLLVGLGSLALVRKRRA